MSKDMRHSLSVFQQKLGLLVRNYLLYKLYDAKNLKAVDSKQLEQEIIGIDTEFRRQAPQQKGSFIDLKNLVNAARGGSSSYKSFKVSPQLSHILKAARYEKSQLDDADYAAIDRGLRESKADEQFTGIPFCQLTQAVDSLYEEEGKSLQTAGEDYRLAELKKSKPTVKSLESLDAQFRRLCQESNGSFKELIETVNTGRTRKKYPSDSFKHLIKDTEKTPVLALSDYIRIDSVIRDSKKEKAFTGMSFQSVYDNLLAVRNAEAPVQSFQSLGVTAPNYSDSRYAKFKQKLNHASGGGSDIELSAILSAAITQKSLEALHIYMEPFYSPEKYTSAARTEMESVVKGHISALIDCLKAGRFTYSNFEIALAAIIGIDQDFCLGYYRNLLDSKQTTNLEILKVIVAGLSIFLDRAAKFELSDRQFIRLIFVFEEVKNQLQASNKYKEIYKELLKQAPKILTKIFWNSNFPLDKQKSIFNCLFKRGMQLEFIRSLCSGSQGYKVQPILHQELQFLLLHEPGEYKSEKLTQSFGVVHDIFFGPEPDEEKFPGEHRAKQKTILNLLIKELGAWVKQKKGLSVSQVEVRKHDETEPLLLGSKEEESDEKKESISRYYTEEYVPDIKEDLPAFIDLAMYLLDRLAFLERRQYCQDNFGRGGKKIDIQKEFNRYFETIKGWGDSYCFLLNIAIGQAPLRRASAREYKNKLLILFSVYFKPLVEFMAEGFDALNKTADSKEFCRAAWDNDIALVDVVNPDFADESKRQEIVKHTDSAHEIRTQLLATDRRLTSTDEEKTDKEILDLMMQMSPNALRSFWLYMNQYGRKVKFSYINRILPEILRGKKESMLDEWQSIITEVREKAAGMSEEEQLRTLWDLVEQNPEHKSFLNSRSHSSDLPLPLFLHPVGGTAAYLLQYALATRDVGKNQEQHDKELNRLLSELITHDNVVGWWIVLETLYSTNLLQSFLSVDPKATLPIPKMFKQWLTHNAGKQDLNIQFYCKEVVYNTALDCFLGIHDPRFLPMLSDWLLMKVGSKDDALIQLFIVKYFHRFTKWRIDQLLVILGRQRNYPRFQKMMEKLAMSLLLDGEIKIECEEAKAEFRCSATIFMLGSDQLNLLKQACSELMKRSSVKTDDIIGFFKNVLTVFYEADEMLYRYYRSDDRIRGGNESVKQKLLAFREDVTTFLAEAATAFRLPNAQEILTGDVDPFKKEMRSFFNTNRQILTDFLGKFNGLLIEKIKGKQELSLRDSSLVKQLIPKLTRKIGQTHVEIQCIAGVILLICLKLKPHQLPEGFFECASQMVIPFYHGVFKGIPKSAIKEDEDEYDEDKDQETDSVLKIMGLRTWMSADEHKQSTHLSKGSIEEKAVISEKQFSQFVFDYRDSENPRPKINTSLIDSTGNGDTGRLVRPIFKGFTEALEGKDDYKPTDSMKESFREFISETELAFLRKAQADVIEYIEIEGNEFCGLLESPAYEVACKYNGRLLEEGLDSEADEGSQAHDDTLFLHVLWALKTRKFPDKLFSDELISKLNKKVISKKFLEKLKLYLRFNFKDISDEIKIESVPEEQKPSSKKSSLPSLAAVYCLFNGGVLEEKKSDLPSLLKDLNANIQAEIKEKERIREVIKERGNDEKWANKDLAIYDQVVSSEGPVCIDHLVDLLRKRFSDDNLPFTDQKPGDASLQGEIKLFLSKTNPRITSERVSLNSSGWAEILLRLAKDYEAPEGAIKRIQKAAVRNLADVLSDDLEVTSPQYSGLFPPRIRQYSEWHAYFHALVRLAKVIDKNATDDPKTVKEILYKALGTEEGKDAEAIDKFLTHYSLLLLPAHVDNDDNPFGSIQNNSSLVKIGEVINRTNISTWSLLWSHEQALPLFAGLDESKESKLAQFRKGNEKVHDSRLNQHLFALVECHPNPFLGYCLAKDLKGYLSRIDYGNQAGGKKLIAVLNQHIKKTEEQQSPELVFAGIQAYFEMKQRSEEGWVTEILQTELDALFKKSASSFSLEKDKTQLTRLKRIRIGTKKDPFIDQVNYFAGVLRLILSPPTQDASAKLAYLATTPPTNRLSVLKSLRILCCQMVNASLRWNNEQIFNSLQVKSNILWRLFQDTSDRPEEKEFKAGTLQKNVKILGRMWQLYREAEWSSESFLEFLEKHQEKHIVDESPVLQKILEKLKSDDDPILTGLFDLVDDFSPIKRDKFIGKYENSGQAVFLASWAKKMSENPDATPSNLTEFVNEQWLNDCFSNLLSTDLEKAESVLAYLKTVFGMNQEIIAKADRLLQRRLPDNFKPERMKYLEESIQGYLQGKPTEDNSSLAQEFSKWMHHRMSQPAAEEEKKAEEKSEEGLLKTNLVHFLKWIFGDLGKNISQLTEGSDNNGIKLLDLIEKSLLELPSDERYWLVQFFIEKKPSSRDFLEPSSREEPSSRGQAAGRRIMAAGRRIMIDISTCIDALVKIEHLPIPMATMCLSLLQHELVNEIKPGNSALSDIINKIQGVLSTGKIDTLQSVKAFIQKQTLIPELDEEQSKTLNDLNSITIINDDSRRILVNIKKILENILRKEILSRKKKIINNAIRIAEKCGISVKKLSDPSAWIVFGEKNLQPLQDLFVRRVNLVANFLKMRKDKSDQFVYDPDQKIESTEGTPEEFKKLLENASEVSVFSDRYITRPDGASKLIRQFFERYITDQDSLKTQMTDAFLKDLDTQIADEKSGFMNYAIQQIFVRLPKHLAHYLMHVLFLHWNYLIREKLSDSTSDSKGFATFREKLLAQIRNIHPIYRSVVGSEDILKAREFSVGSLVELHQVLKSVSKPKPQDAVIIADVQKLFWKPMQQSDRSIPPCQLTQETDSKVETVEEWTEEKQYHAHRIRMNVLGALLNNLLSKPFATDLAALFEKESTALWANKQPKQIKIASLLSAVIAKTTANQNEAKSLLQICKEGLDPKDELLAASNEEALKKRKDIWPVIQSIVTNIIDALDNLRSPKRILRESLVQALIEGVLSEKPIHLNIEKSDVQEYFIEEFSRSRGLFGLPGREEKIRTRHTKNVLVRENEPIGKCVDQAKFPDFIPAALWYQKMRWLSGLVKPEIQWWRADSLTQRIETRYLFLLDQQRAEFQGSLKHLIPEALQSGDDNLALGLFYKWHRQRGFELKSVENSQKFTLSINFDSFESSLLSISKYNAYFPLMGETGILRAEDVDKILRGVKEVKKEGFGDDKPPQMEQLKRAVLRHPRVTVYMLQLLSNACPEDLISSFGNSSEDVEQHLLRSCSNLLKYVDDGILSHHVEAWMARIKQVVQLKGSLEFSQLLQDFYNIFIKKFQDASPELGVKFYKSLLACAVKQWKTKKDQFYAARIAAILRFHHHHIVTENIADLIGTAYLFPDVTGEERVRLSEQLAGCSPPITRTSLLEDYLVDKGGRDKAFDITACIERYLDEEKIEPLDFFSEDCFDEAYNTVSFMARLLHRLGMDRRKTLIFRNDLYMLGGPLQSQLIGYLNGILLKGQDIKNWNDFYQNPKKQKIQKLIRLLWGRSIKIIDEYPDRFELWFTPTFDSKQKPPIGEGRQAVVIDKDNFAYFVIDGETVLDEKGKSAKRIQLTSSCLGEMSRPTSGFSQETGHLSHQIIEEATSKAGYSPGIPEKEKVPEQMMLVIKKSDGSCDLGAMGTQGHLRLYAALPIEDEKLTKALSKQPAGLLTDIKMREQILQRVFGSHGDTSFSRMDAWPEVDLAKGADGFGINDIPLPSTASDALCNLYPDLLSIATESRETKETKLSPQSQEWHKAILPFAFAKKLFNHFCNTRVAKKRLKALQKLENPGLYEPLQAYVALLEFKQFVTECYQLAEKEDDCEQNISDLWRKIEPIFGVTVKGSLADIRRKNDFEKMIEKHIKAAMDKLHLMIESLINFPPSVTQISGQDQRLIRDIFLKDNFLPESGDPIEAFNKTTANIILAMSGKLGPNPRMQEGRLSSGSVWMYITICPAAKPMPAPQSPLTKSSVTLFRKPASVEQSSSEGLRSLLGDAGLSIPHTPPSEEKADGNPLSGTSPEDDDLAAGLHHALSQPPGAPPEEGYDPEDIGALALIGEKERQDLEDRFKDVVGAQNSVNINSGYTLV
jgi:hypothetical protein